MTLFSNSWFNSISEQIGFGVSKQLGLHLNRNKCCYIFMNGDNVVRFPDGQKFEDEVISWTSNHDMLFSTSPLIYLVPVSARPAPGRKFRKMGNGYKKSMAYRKVFAMQKQLIVEVVRCINEWANGAWNANEMTWKNPCTTDRMNPWINEINEWVN